MTDTQIKKYLIVIEMDKSSNLVRLAKDLPPITTMLQCFSKGDVLLAFKSSDGILTGSLITTSVTPAQIRGTFQTLNATTNADHILILELGNDADSTQNFSRALTWMQRH